MTKRVRKKKAGGWGNTAIHYFSNAIKNEYKVEEIKKSRASVFSVTHQGMAFSKKQVLAPGLRPEAELPRQSVP